MSLLFHLYILLAILVLYNIYTLIAIFLLPVSSVFPTQTLCATPYEFLMFTQQWPKAVRKGSPFTQFTIHGLWPSNVSVPVLPCNGTKFDRNKMTKDLIKNLTISWPDVKSGKNMKFWEEEYNKHGRCSEETFCQIQYFEFSHKMWNKWNITRMLAQSSIVPGAKYKRSQVEDAIKIKTKSEPNLRCKGNILHEVVVCYDHDGDKEIDCDPNKTNCSAYLFYVN